MTGKTRQGVLHLLSSSGFHGAESVVLELCRGQIEDGRPAAVMLLKTPGADVAEFESRFAEASVPFSAVDVAGRFDRRAVAAIRERLAGDAVGFLHSHKYKTTVFALLAARGRRVRVVATYHNWLHETWLLKLYARLDKFLVRFCDACVAVSGPVYDELERRRPNGGVWLIRNGVDTRRWRPVEAQAPKPDGAPLTVGFVGRISHDKGAAEFVEAIALTPQIGGRPLHGLIVGDGELRAELERRGGSEEIGGRLTFTGSVRDVAAQYARMDLLALPSRNEACPMVVLEAMACGLPVVATRVGDLPDILEHGDSGWLIDRLEPGDLAKAFVSVLENEQRTTAMGGRSRELIRARYSTEFMVSQYESVYAASE